SRNERYLSPEFLEKVAFTSRKARELGLRTDVTIGSGWSYGGPYITPDLASARLRSDRREITPARTTVARPAPYQGDRLIAGFIGRGPVAAVEPTRFRTPDLASTRLRSDRREITPERTSVARPVPYEGDRLIAAFIGRGSVAEVDPTSFRELDISGAGPIALPPGDGPRLVLLYFSSQTG